MGLLRDPSGQIIWPGRVVRTVTDPMIPGGALASWLTVNAGTGTYGTFTGASSTGWAKITSAATNNSVAAVKTATPLNVIQPNNFRALALTFEALRMDADTGYDFQMGFSPSSTGGGVLLYHTNGASQAVIRVKNAAGTITDTPINYQVFQGSGGGRYTRNLTLLVVPNGFPGVGATSPMAYVLEDDQIMAEVDITTGSDMSQGTVGILAVTVKDAVAHFIQWEQAKLTLVR